MSGAGRIPLRTFGILILSGAALFSQREQRRHSEAIHCLGEGPEGVRGDDLRSPPILPSRPPRRCSALLRSTYDLDLVAAVEEWKASVKKSHAAAK